MFAETSSCYVTRNPEILGGEPIITGTRTSIRAIVGLSWLTPTQPSPYEGGRSSCNDNDFLSLGLGL